MDTITMTPDEKIAVAIGLVVDMEEDFIQLGQLLSEIKKTKLFKFKGFKTLKEFVETEFNLTGSIASKIMSNYALYIDSMDLDEQTVKSVGLEKLNIIKPLVSKLDYKDAIEWIDRAKDVSATDLRAEVKEVKEKEVSLTPKEVFVDQYIEKMVTWFNCNKKELDFKLALYFQDRHLEDIGAEIKMAQRRFEED